MRDLYNNIEVRRGQSPIAAQTNDDPIVSEIIDMRGFKSMVFVIVCGEIADANVTFATLIEDGDDSGLSDNDDVPNSQLDPTEAIATPKFGSDDSVRKIGVVTEKRYVRMTITPTGNSGNLFMAIVAILGDADQRETTAQAN